MIIFNVTMLWILWIYDFYECYDFFEWYYCYLNQLKDFDWQQPKSIIKWRLSCSIGQSIIIYASLKALTLWYIFSCVLHFLPVWYCLYHKLTPVPVKFGHLVDGRSSPVKTVKRIFMFPALLSFDAVYIIKWRFFQSTWPTGWWQGKPSK